MIEDHLNKKPHLSGIFITHAHLGHYMGLLELGLEVMNTDTVPVYVMPKMKLFLENNAPFSQLVDLNNINLIEIEENKPIRINEIVNITPFQVPHRNEFSETVGYSIRSKHKSVIYIPDIDSWEKWEININEMINEHDIAFLDGTFYDKIELKNRNIEDVPHPSIRESMKKFSSLDSIDREKVNFTHLNHTNNALIRDSVERNEVLKQGFKIASEGTSFSI
jgi:pyrroloquinoline quinone biosynthesis protein B